MVCSLCVSTLTLFRPILNASTWWAMDLISVMFGWCVSVLSNLQINSKLPKWNWTELFLCAWAQVFYFATAMHLEVHSNTRDTLPLSVEFSRSCRTAIVSASTMLHNLCLCWHLSRSQPPAITAHNLLSNPKWPPSTFLDFWTSMTLLQ